MKKKKIPFKIIIWLCLFLGYMFNISTVVSADEKKRIKPAFADNTITFSTYYPAPFGVYKKLITDEFEAKSIKTRRLVPSYDSGWVAMPLVIKGNRRFYFLELSHHLGTVDTLVQIETKVPDRNERALEEAFGYLPLPYGPGIYKEISGYPTLRIPLYTKDENNIEIVVPILPQEKEEDFFVRVLMWIY